MLGVWTSIDILQGLLSIFFKIVGKGQGARGVNRTISFFLVSFSFSITLAQQQRKSVVSLLLLAPYLFERLCGLYIADFYAKCCFFLLDLSYLHHTNTTST
jgi:hypothetical protein